MSFFKLFADPRIAAAAKRFGCDSADIAAVRPGVCTDTVEFRSQASAYRALRAVSDRFAKLDRVQRGGKTVYRVSGV